MFVQFMSDEQFPILEIYLALVLISHDDACTRNWNKNSLLSIGKYSLVEDLRILKNQRFTAVKISQPFWKFLHSIPSFSSSSHTSLSRYLAKQYLSSPNSSVSHRSSFSFLPPPGFSVQLLSFRRMRTRDALLQIQMGTYANGATCYYTFPYTNNVLIGPAPWLWAARTSWIPPSRAQAIGLRAVETDLSIIPRAFLLLLLLLPPPSPPLRGRLGWYISRR